MHGKHGRSLRKRLRDLESRNSGLRQKSPRVSDRAFGKVRDVAAAEAVDSSETPYPCRSVCIRGSSPAERVGIAFSGGSPGIVRGKQPRLHVIYIEPRYWSSYLPLSTVSHPLRIPLFPHPRLFPRRVFPKPSIFRLCAEQALHHAPAACSHADASPVFSAARREPRHLLPLFLARAALLVSLHHTDGHAHALRVPDAP